MGYPIQKNQTAQPLQFLLVSSTNHIVGVTGVTPTVTIRKVGGTFVAPAGAVTEVGNGWYEVAGNAADSDTLGPLLLHATAAGADPCDERFDVVAFDPQDVPGALYGSIAVNSTTFRELLRDMAAVSCGDLVEAADGSTSEFKDIGDHDPDTLPRVTSVNTATTRTVTIR